jgi:Transglycosylase SLT domain
MLRRLMARRLTRCAGARAAASGSRALALRGVAGCGALVLLGTGAHAGIMQPAPGGSGGVPARSAAAAAREAASFGQIILPDLLIVAPSGLTSAQQARLGKIAGVRNMIAFDGARIKAGSHAVTVIGVNPSAFRSWVPLQTATDQPFWTALASGQFVASQDARSALGLRRGASYQLTGATSQTVTFGAAASLGIQAVDLLVDTQLSRKLGLVHQVAALISAPGTGLATLIAKVRAVLGPSGKIVSLRQQQLPATPATPAAPATPALSGQPPATYLQLFQESAAEYCPGLSWTVLAAIGQIESADGTNMGPSSAGALGPMQFLPSTWAVWGIDAFGQAGPPDIMNPYDAVPSAARMLCADGAGSGASGLAAAIFDYNHATWYVNEVLGLAAEYARDFP